MRRGQCDPQQVEGLVLVVAQHAQAAAEGVAGGAEGELDGAAVEPLMERLGVEIAGALVEEVADKIGDAGLVVGILRRAAGKGIFHGDQRHGRVLDEPGLDAARRDQVLDLRRRLRGRDRGKRECRTGGDGQREVTCREEREWVTNASPRAWRMLVSLIR